MIELPEQQPRAVAKAAQVVVEREADVEAAKQAILAAKASIREAIVEDRNRAADALDRGEDDPGREAEDEARRELAECERRLGVQELRVARAREAFETTCREQSGAWQETLTTAVVKAEAEAIEAVDALQAAESKRSRLRRDLLWLERGQLTNLPPASPALSPIVVNPMAGPQCHTVPDLVAGVRAGIERVTLAAERARAEEREQREAEPRRLHVAES